MKHNKKRNVGLLYEFLIQYASRCLISNDDTGYNNAMSIIETHFRDGTELMKEFRLFRSLVSTTIKDVDDQSSRRIIDKIISEAKNLSLRINQAKLQIQKDKLVESINNLNLEDFFDQPIQEYKAYATVQTLLNQWRSHSSDFVTTSLYEENLSKLLITEKAQKLIEEVDSAQLGMNRLAYKLMIKKLNEKYGKSLSDVQKKIIKEYVMYGNTSNLLSTLSDVKEKTLASIDAVIITNDSNSYIVKKLNEVKECIMTESLDNLDDSKLSRFLLYTSMKDQLESYDGDDE